MDTTILLKLVFAHILSDFLLQTNTINNGKKGFRSDANEHKVPITKSKKYGYQILHSLTHAVSSYLIVGEWSCWIIPLTILVSHFVIDYIKSGYIKPTLLSFSIDQVLHLSVIFIIWLFILGNERLIIDWLARNWNSTLFWSIATAYIVVLKPTSIFLNLFISRWEPEKTKELNLPNAGKWIGYMERFLIVTFIITHNFEATGFLLAAKSIFRFGDLTKVREIKLTEYVLIGTFASFTMAIIVGFILLSALKI